MALPTYDKKVTQVGTPRQTQGGTQGGAGFIASAQAGQSLAQKLQAFSSQMGQMSAGMAQSQAAKDATLDIYKRKEKVNKINSDTNLTEEQKANEIANISEGTARMFSGIYSKSYESAASSAYSNQIGTDAKVAYDIAMAEPGVTSESFLKSYGAFSKETTAGAPTEATAILAQQTTTKYGASGYKALKTAEMRANTEGNRTRLKDNMDVINKQFSDAYYSGDAVEIARLGGLATSIQDSGVRDGLISPAESGMALASIVDRAVMDAARRKFGEMNSEGMGIRAYKMFTDAELNGDLETQDPEEVAKFKSSMLRQIKESNDATLMRDTYEAERFDIISDSTFREGTTMVARGELTEAQVTEWEATSLISTANADQLRERLARGFTKMESDAKTLGRYNEPTALLDTNDETIKDDPLLSEPDKTALLTKKAALLKTRYNWRATDQGREAVRRIKSNFGIQEGTLMAKIDLNNQTMRDFDNLYKEFYAQVTQLENPAEDAVTVADQLLNGYKQKQIDKKIAEAQATEARRKEEAQNAANAANDSILVKIGWIDEVNAEDMMMEK